MTFLDRVRCSEGIMGIRRSERTQVSTGDVSQGHRGSGRKIYCIGPLPFPRRSFTQMETSCRYLPSQQQSPQFCKITLSDIQVFQKKFSNANQLVSILILICRREKNRLIIGEQKKKRKSPVLLVGHIPALVCVAWRIGRRGLAARRAYCPWCPA
jgi:hypothetical protein